MAKKIAIGILIAIALFALGKQIYPMFKKEPTVNVIVIPENASDSDIEKIIDQFRK